MVGTAAATAGYAGVYCGKRTTRPRDHPEGADASVGCTGLGVKLLAMSDEVRAGYF